MNHWFGKSVAIVAALLLGACKLNVSVEGEGVVSADDGSIQCGESCSASYTENKTVQLSAVAANGFYFSAWEGCAHSEGTICSIEVGPNRSRNAKAVFKPDFVATLYALDFEPPTYQPGDEVLQGPELRMTPIFPIEDRQPVVSDQVAALDGQSLLFDRPHTNNPNTQLLGDAARLNFGYGADAYQLDMDIVVTGNAGTNYSGIQFNFLSSNILLSFNADGQLIYNKTTVGYYQVGTPFHLSAHIDPLTGTIEFSVDGAAIAAAQPLVLIYDIPDLLYITIRHFNDYVNAFAIDNIEVKGIWKRDFVLPQKETDTGYLIAFDSPILDPKEELIVEPMHFEDGFIFSQLAMTDNYYANSSSARVVLNGYTNSAVTLYHRYGYSFALRSMQVIYSGNGIDANLIGQTRSGETLKRSITQPGAVSFDSEWQDLDQVRIEGNIAFDDVALDISREESVFSH